MVLRKGVDTLDVDAMTTDEVYAAWGTTENDHLGRMLSFIDNEKKKARGTTRKQAMKRRFAGVRVAASRGRVTAADVEAELRRVLEETGGLKGMKVAEVVKGYKSGKGIKAAKGLKVAKLKAAKFKRKG